jgi:hypothetical protein
VFVRQHVVAGCDHVGKLRRVLAADRRERQAEAAMAAGATRASDRGEPVKWSKFADQILVVVKHFCQKTQQTLCSEL